MVWWEGIDDFTNCYFSEMNIKVIYRKNKHHVQCLNLPSAVIPIPHGLDLSVLEPKGNMGHSSDSEHSNMTVATGDDAYKTEEDDQLVPLIQAELNDLIQELERNLINGSVHVSKRKIFWHQQQRSMVSSAFSKTFALWKTQRRLVGCKLSRWILLVLETGCRGCWWHRLKVWCDRMETLYWHIYMKSQSNSST